MGKVILAFLPEPKRRLLLEAVRFERCELRETEFYHTLLAGIDLRDSDLAGLRVTALASRELRGLHVTSLQALELARLLGIEVEE